jgi:hypothetical protein
MMACHDKLKHLHFKTPIRYAVRELYGFAVKALKLFSRKRLWDFAILNTKIFKSMQP